MTDETTSATANPSPSGGTSRRWTWQDLLLLAGILVIAVWIRLTHLDSGLSFDELWHLASTQGIGDAMRYYPNDVVHHDAIRLTSLEHKQNLWEVWKGMDNILHPPLFIVVLRLWRDLFGQSELAAHCFSVFFGAVSIVFTYASGKLAMNRPAAALAALALACSQTQVYFSQEVRAYAMLIGIASCALWLMTRIEVLGATRRRLILLALLTLPLLLTHYFTIGGCLAIGIYGWIAGKGHRKVFLSALVACALVFTIVWVPFAVRQLDHLGTGDEFLRTDPEFIHILLLGAGTPFRLLVERDYTIERTPLLSAVLFVVPWFLVKRNRALLPWAIWLSAAIAPIFALDVLRDTVHTAFIRYLAIATPPVTLLFIGTIWSLGWKRLSYAFGGLLSFAGVIYIASQTRVLLDAKDLNTVNQILEKRFQKGDAIVTTAGVLTPPYAAALAMQVSHSQRLFPATLVIATKPLTREMVHQLGTRTIWLVGGELDVEIGEYIPGGRVESTEVATSDITVRRVVIDEPTTSPTSPADGTKEIRGGA